MKIIVVSDTHRRETALERVLRLHPDAGAVVHLGDSETGLYELREKFPAFRYIMVRGNCDFSFGGLSDVELFTFEGVRFMATHGHRFGVKFGLGELRAAAFREDVQVALYGHTHIAHIEYADGLYLLNPGACWGNHAPYAVIEVKDGQVLANLTQL